MLTFYTSPTPNCQKVAIFLAEAGLACEQKEISLMDGEQKQPEFLAVNPNARVPALVDDDFHSVIWESGAILIHLAEVSKQFLPVAPDARAEVMQWLMFQMSALGPSQGSANVFSRYVPEKVDWIIERFRRETLRIYSVLNDKLAEQAYIAGEYSIADMAIYPWIRMHGWAGLTLDGLENLQRWKDTVAARSAVQQTMAYYEPDMSAFDNDDFSNQTSNILN